MLQACLAKTVVDVVTLPVDAASKTVDLATTSQSEADEKRGRELRKREERLGKLEKEYNQEAARCAEGEEEACTKRDAAAAEIRQLMPSIPVEPGN